MTTSFTPGVTRATRPAVSISSGPIPRRGERAPQSTWYRPLNSRVFSIAARLPGSSTTHRSVASRCGSEQISHGSSSVSVLQVEQRRTAARDSRIARGQALGVVVGGAQQVIRQARGALGSDPRQTLELGGETLERLRGSRSTSASPASCRPASTASSSGRPRPRGGTPRGTRRGSGPGASRRPRGPRPPSRCGRRGSPWRPTSRS